jgi:hypothetical protein
MSLQTTPEPMLDVVLNTLPEPCSNTYSVVEARSLECQGQILLVQATVSTYNVGFWKPSNKIECAGCGIKLIVGEWRAHVGAAPTKLLTLVHNSIVSASTVEFKTPKLRCCLAAYTLGCLCNRTNMAIVGCAQDALARLGIAAPTFSVIGVKEAAAWIRADPTRAGTLFKASSVGWIASSLEALVTGRAVAVLPSIVLVEMTTGDLRLRLTPAELRVATQLLRLANAKRPISSVMCV